MGDPEADDDDQRWVASELLRPDSVDCRSTDAVLNCPGCFTPICYQCQRHDFSRQWRATEVRNCIVDRSAALAACKDSPNERFFAVRCELCSADVGLLDQ